MVRKNILRITASINPFAVENGLLALVGMQLERRTHKQTMEKISRLKGVVSVSNATGRYDLLVEVFLDSQQELNRFLMEDLSRIGGINATETYIYLHAINKWVELS
jgi:Lrp/AsnC family transcriptional regulator for asnA, asnC and gidA